jgi:hypothetical protein
MDIRSAILESRRRDKETRNIKNKGFKGIAREQWVSDSIPGPRLIIVPGKYGGKRNYYEMVPYGMGGKYYGSGWEPTFDDLVATDWFVTIMTRKIELKGGD